MLPSDAARPAHATRHTTSGFPSPAEDVAERSLDLQALVVRRPAATFFLRMRGDAMQRAGVFAGDILVVDRSLRPTARRLIVLAVAGELLVRRYIRAASHYGVIFVAGGDDASIAIPLGNGLGNGDAGLGDDAAQQAVVWGVVAYVIHRADTLPDSLDAGADAGANGDRYADVPDVG